MIRTKVWQALVVLAAMAFASIHSAQADLLFDNGPFITHPGGMTGTVAGADRSAISPGGTLFGTGAAAPNIRIADDFQLSSASTINSFTVWAYTTGATTPTATGLTIRVWDGTPGAVGSSIVWGDTLTNVLTSTGWEAGPSGLGVYRTTTTDTIGSTRRVQFLTAGGLNVALAAGTYWLDFQYSGTNFTPVLSSTSAVVSGNAIQSQDGGVTYGFQVLDGGVQTGLPFLVEGVSAIPEPGSIAFLALSALGLFVSRRRR
jgi:hypothetical protein